jgi:hypothetical protein
VLALPKNSIAILNDIDAGLFNDVQNDFIHLVAPFE